MRIPPQPSETFVNRELELARLNELADRIGGAGSHAALIGLRRIGKTVLLDEFARQQRIKQRLVARVDADDAANTPDVWMRHVARALMAAALQPTDAPADPTATAIRRALPKVPPSLVEPIEDLLSAADSRRAQSYNLFAGSLRLPQRFAAAFGRRLILCIDEFPEVLRFKNSAQLRGLEGTLRAIFEKESPNVMLVITGSAVRRMRALLEGNAPLLTRLETIEVGRFDVGAANLLIDALVQAPVTITPDARDDVLRYAQGHPFYIARLVGRVVDFAKRDRTQRLEQKHVASAFHAEVIAPSGQIAKACSWIFDKSLGERAGEDDRNLLRRLSAADASLRPVDLANALGWEHYKVLRRVEELAASGLLTRSDNSDVSLIAFADPVFAVWLERRTGKVGPSTRESVASLERLLARTVHEASSWYESYARDAMWHFSGQRYSGAAFGLPGKIVLPKFSMVDPNPKEHDAAGEVHGEASSVEADGYGALNGTGWLLEVKAARVKATKSDVELLAKKVAFFAKHGRSVAQAWLVAREGFTQEAIDAASRLGIAITTGAQLRKLFLDLTVRKKSTKTP